MTKRIASATGWLLALTLRLTSGVANAEAGGGDGWLPSLRVVGGLNVYPDVGGPSGVFGLTAGGRVQLGDDMGLGLSGELGWNYEAGTLPEANHLSITFGADLGGRLVQLGIFGTFLVGSAASDLSLGGRVTGRLELLWGIFGLEIGYEGLEIAGTLNNGVTVTAGFDIGVLVFYGLVGSNWLSRQAR